MLVLNPFKKEFIIMDIDNLSSKEIVIYFELIEQGIQKQVVLQSIYYQRTKNIEL